MNKFSSLKIAIGFVVLVAGAWFGWQAYSAHMVDGKKFAEIPPGKVTLVGLQPGLNYKIVVSNGVAQLVQTSSQMGVGEMNDSSDSQDDATNKRHIPLKETLLSLGGNIDALGKLVTTMDDDLRKAQEDIPPFPVIWEAADVRKAIAGDSKLKVKLEKDLNVKLDGTPVDFVSRSALYKGIVLRIPVPVKVNVVGQQKVLRCTIQVPYRTSFTKAVEKSLTDKGLSPSDSTISGYYLQAVADLVKHPKNKENVQGSLEDRLSDDQIKTYSDAAERVLSNTKIVLNDSFIRGASMDENDGPNGKKFYDLNIDLTDEGRERLWQYSRQKKVGTQLLLICNNVAIAAPTIRHELAQSSLTVTQMQDQSLVEEARDAINSKNKTASRFP